MLLAKKSVRAVHAPYFESLLIVPKQLAHARVLDSWVEPWELALAGTRVFTA